ncbi:MAG: hypothetical protein ACRDK9_03000 [Solirubrobacterales bacterium]
MSRKPMLLLVAVAALAAPLTLAACGDDDDDDDDATTEAAAEETAGPTEVTLTADDAGGNYTFELSEAPTAETETVVFDNQGAEPHAIVYAKINEGFTVDEAYELEGRQGSAEVLIEDGARPGQSKTLEITGEATPGDYAMLCPIPSPEGVHYELGQLEEFTIE